MFINKVTTDAYRGAGRPEATDAIERLMDTIARELHLDPAEIRWRNFLRDLSRPTCVDLLYDSGNYPAAVDKALALVGYEALRAEQQRLRAQGRLPGDWPRILYGDLRGWPVVPPAARHGRGRELCHSCRAHGHGDGADRRLAARPGQ